MTAGRWKKIKAVFDSALEMVPEERPAFLEQACGGDDALKEEVGRLLAEFRDTESFLDSPVFPLDKGLSPGDVIGGRYRVTRQLGRGGMGEVYEVVDELLHESVALKTLRSDRSYDAALLRRFQVEVQLARKVTHPNVCRVFEVGVHSFPGGDRPPMHFFTLQLLSGETLASRIHRAGRMSASEAFPFIVQMAEGLQAAHNEGIIHRDFKSANVMIVASRAVITDFGLAGLAPGLAASAGSVSSGARIAGTVAYMSPEQLSGGPITAASDIYSLGVVMFEMATGRLPFEEGHIIQSAMQRVRGEPPSVRQSTPDVDARWEFAIRRCLEVEPAKRFASASELAGLFQNRTWRPPHLYWSRRKWAQAAAAGAAPVIGGWALWTWSHRPYRPKPEALVWFEKGVEALRSATPEAARRSLEKAVTTDPRYAPSYAYFAAAYRDLDASERANETMLKGVTVAQDERLNRTDALRFNALRYVISGEFERAQPLFEQLYAAAPDREKAAASVDLAWLAWKRQDTQGMIPPLEQALRLNPSYAGAKLWLAFAVDRQGKKDAAQNLFAEAEGLFQSASNYDGVVETLLQRAISLGRTTRASEAVALIDRGTAVARSIGDLHHEIQLRLALALTYRTMGQPGNSREVAEAAVRMAIENRMDQPAAIGLVDLGNAYFQLDEPDQAERYFQQGLEFASRGRALFSEARAKLSLAALRDKYDRPREVPKYVQPALAFFAAAGYRREALQSNLILGGAQESLARFEEAEKTQREAIRLADQLHDAEQTGLAHLYLSSVLMKLGRWPESLTEKDRALAVFGDMRGGYRAAYTLVSRARLLAQMGRFEEASSDLKRAAELAARLEGKQPQLRARLALGGSEIAAYQLQWAETLRSAREAQALNGGTVENLQAAVLAGLALIRMGSMESGIATCERAIRSSEEVSQPYLAASAKLSLAEALRTSPQASYARASAEEASTFFEPHQNWEAIWRARRVLGSNDRPGFGQAALDNIKRSWPEDSVHRYLQRPDIKKLALP
ncbi:MAG: hypothetical protein C5B51_29280 [Terriglobia bacterium]|nr:MAG: hypothetical protein C5B51_29280 [Terriglobia bacterium]